MPIPPDSNRSGKEHYRRYPIPSLALGVNDSMNPARLRDGEMSLVENVDFDRDSVKGTGGALKFGNQPLPTAGVLTRATFGALPLAAGVSVPQRGRVDIPYSQDTDIGGNFALDDGGVPTDPFGHSYHTRRGGAFDFTVSFMLPADEKLFDRRITTGVDQSDGGVSSFGGLDRYDEALEECTLIVQKGGDGLSAMSWALGIVNTGRQFEAITGFASADRVSNYALVFMWLDAPGWGAMSPLNMRYLVGAGGANVGSTGRSSTQAYRAVVANYFVEPGRAYHVSVGLKLDTGSSFSGGTAADPTATWNGDGVFTIAIRDDAGSFSELSSSNGGLAVWKGPTDSLQYLTRYGVRFSGRDMLHVGLGYRFMPWSGWGFVPCGMDSAPLEAGGFRMLDIGAQAKPAAFTPTHQVSHAGANSYVTINSQGMHGGTDSNCPNPLDPRELGVAVPWGGLYDTASATIPNQGTASRSEALRNYWLVPWGGNAAPDTERNGPRLKIEYYTESGASYRFEVSSGAGLPAFSNLDFCIVGFRWHQRPLLVSNFRIYDGDAVARDWTSERERWTLGAASRLEDANEPNGSALLACWPLGDAGGGACRELVGGRTAFLAPHTLGKGGGVYLSGEGEAVVLDLSEHPVFEREMRAMLRSQSQGFAIELVVRIPQAHYARIEAPASGGRRARFAPVLASWECQGDEPGYEESAAPILRLTHGALYATGTGTSPFFFPQGFSVEAAVGNDQESGALQTVIEPWSSSTASRWDLDAPWVGQSVRIQVGVQSTGTADQFNVYIAATPKSAFLPADGDPSEAEFAYFSTTTIDRRDLARTAVVIGGAWRPDSLGMGELRARLVLEEVIVYGAAAPGALPASSGGIVTSRNGKLSGSARLPLRRLEPSDLLHPLGPQKCGIETVAGDDTILPASGGVFFDGQPEASLDALRETYLLSQGDTLTVGLESTRPKRIEEFYWVSSVAAGGSSATLSRGFEGGTRSNGGAWSFRVIGYTAFADDTSRKAITAGGGALAVGATDPSAVSITDQFWQNVAPVSAPWRVAFLQGGAAVADVIPRWWRGLSTPRRNPVLGLRSVGDRLFAATRGSLFEADDRWRADGPTDAATSSIEIRAEDLGGVSMPLEQDRIEFATATNVRVSNLSFRPIYYDAWVKLNAYHDYQTILWVGSKATDPSKDAGTHKVHLWTRLARGYPEIALGSTEAAAGGVPEKGLYVARSSGRVPLGVWTHVRFVLRSSGGTNDISQSVDIYLNGRATTVSLNAIPAAAVSPRWLAAASLTGSGEVAVIGAARDSYRSQRANGVFADGDVGGRILEPERIDGWLHALDGLICEVACAQDNASNFTPSAITYSSPRFYASLQEGVGHRPRDAGTAAQYGVVVSHPGISLLHELGAGESPAAWASYGNRLFVTTGGRPAYVEVP